MITEIDKNNDGEIQFEEFVAVMSRKVQATYTADEVKAAFKVFESGAPAGFVKVTSALLCAAACNTSLTSYSFGLVVQLSALENALKTYGSHTLTPAQVKELINQVCTCFG
jgi:hypothetical protein